MAEIFRALHRARRRDLVQSVNTGSGNLSIQNNLYSFRDIVLKHNRLGLQELIVL